MNNRLLKNRFSLVVCICMLLLTAFSVTQAFAVEDEIKELARALQYDPVQIYDYVKNHIDYEPYYGLRKGALGTYLDLEGNDYDQAALLVELLLESKNYNSAIQSASYVHGEMFMDGYNLANWLGVHEEYTGSGDDARWQSIIYYLKGASGVPSSIYQNGDAYVSRAWVKLTVSGITYYLDAAFKNYENTEAINIGAATGYSRSTFLDAVSSGATQTVDYIQNANDGNLRNKMTEYSMNLVDTIKDQYPNSSVEEVISGRKILRSDITTLPSQVSFDTRNVVYWTDIPDTHIAKLRIQHEGIDHTFKTTDFAGKRLTLTWEPSSGSYYRPVIRLEGVSVDTGNEILPAQQKDVTFTVSYPYVGYPSGQSETRSKQIITGSTYTIVSSFGGRAGAALNKRQQILNDYLLEGKANGSEEVLGESLNLFGINWFAQRHLGTIILANLCETVFTEHYDIALMRAEDNYCVDGITARIYPSPRHYYDDTAKNIKNTHMMTMSLLGSASEHAILDQGSDYADQGVSTVKGLFLANEGGGKVYLADSSNYASIKTQLTGYTEDTKTAIQTIINDNGNCCLPQNGALTLGDWTGYVYLGTSKFSNDSIKSIAAIISGMNGGISTNTDPVNYDTLTSNASLEVAYGPETVSAPTSFDPVDLLSGAFLYDNRDIGIGTNRSLGFARSYNSAVSGRESVLGNGWSYNYDINLAENSSYFKALGTTVPVHCASAIAGMYVMLDLMQEGYDVRDIMASSLVTKWITDQLFKNSMFVKTGSSGMEFVELADGTYASPEGRLTTTLVENADDTFTLKERFGTEMDFNSDNKVSQIKDIDGNTTTFNYNTDKTLHSVSDNYYHTLTLSYGSGKISGVSDGTGRSVSYFYNGDDLDYYLDVEGKKWDYNYDSNHRMTGIVNPLLTTTVTNTYDSLGRVKTQTQPRQTGNALYKFYFSNYKTMEEDPLGNITTHYYDKKGRNIAVVDALGSRAEKEYDGQWHVIKVTDPLGNSASYVYNDDNNLEKAIDALGRETQNIYDSEFRLKNVIDYLGNTVVHNEYYTDHHLKLTRDAENNETNYTYYPSGLIETAADGRGIVTYYGYDSYGSIYSQAVGSHPSVTTNYGIRGPLDDITDRIYETTDYLNSNRNQVTDITDVLSHVTIAIYDDAGRRRYVTDRNNDQIEYIYTPGGLPEEIIYPDNSKVKYFYDVRDNCTDIYRYNSTGGELGHIHYTYDAVNRIEIVTDEHGFVYSYEYDAAGNVEKIIYPGNKAVSYTYDEVSRVETITLDWLSKTAYYQYDINEDGRFYRVKFTNFNGTITTYETDMAGRKTRLADRRSGGQIISEYEVLERDGNGNIKRIDRQEPIIFASTLNKETHDYDYDKFGDNFTGNRLSGYEVKIYTPGTENVIHNAQMGPGSYDAVGQIKSYGTGNYYYDYNHRLIHAQNIFGTTSLHFDYDGAGSRIKADRSGTVTNYGYGIKGTLLVEADGSKNVTRYYIYGAGGLIALIDRPSDAVYCYHYNETGSTVAVTDSSETIVNKYSYTPFGMITEEQETVAQPFTFIGRSGVMKEPSLALCNQGDPGQPYEALYFMNARYYNATLGRFISEDLIGFQGGDISLYAYSGNNPVNYSDPSGLCYNTQGVTYAEPGESPINTDPDYTGIKMSSSLVTVGVGLATGNPAVIGAGLAGYSNTVTGGDMNTYVSSVAPTPVAVNVLIKYGAVAATAFNFGKDTAQNYLQTDKSFSESVKTAGSNLGVGYLLNRFVGQTPTPIKQFFATIFGNMWAQKNLNQP